jgi:hypothetical protein
VPLSLTVTERTVALTAYTVRAASRPTPVVPSAGVTVTDGGLSAASWLPEVEPGRGLEVGLAEAAGARLHPVSATATTPRATTQAPRLTAERVTPITVRRPGPKWRLPSPGASHSWRDLLP